MSDRPNILLITHAALRHVRINRHYWGVKQDWSTPVRRWPQLVRNGGQQLGCEWVSRGDWGPGSMWQHTRTATASRSTSPQSELSHW